MRFITCVRCNQPTCPVFGANLCHCGCGTTPRTATSRFAWGHRIRLDQTLRYAVNNETACWEYTGPKNAGGYGRATTTSAKGVQGQHLVHRLSYEKHKGEIPEGSVVRHLCHNPACINPQHLELGTQSQNAMDSVAAFRWSRQLPKEAQVELLRLYGEERLHINDIAERIGCHPHHVTAVARRAGVSRPRRSGARAAGVTPQLVRQVREEHAEGGVSYSKLAQKYGRSKEWVADVVKLRIWKNVTEEHDG